MTMYGLLSCYVWMILFIALSVISLGYAIYNRGDVVQFVCHLGRAACTITLAFVMFDITFAHQRPYIVSASFKPSVAVAADPIVVPNDGGIDSDSWSEIQKRHEMKLKNLDVP